MFIFFVRIYAIFMKIYYYFSSLQFILTQKQCNDTCIHEVHKTENKTHFLMPVYSAIVKVKIVIGEQTFWLPFFGNEQTQFSNCRIDTAFEVNI